MNAAKRRSAPLAILAVLGIFAYIPPAQAYLDPGTGSIMLQALIGSIAGAMVAGRLYWQSIKGFFSSRFGPKADASSDVQDNR